MRFVADEGVDAPIVRLLREEEYDVYYIAEVSPSIDDVNVLEIAKTENRILITLDKDFGDLVYQRKLLHKGIILGRLNGVKPTTKARMLLNVIQKYENELYNSFVVVQPGVVRIKQL